jgi:hypothetical protein
MKKDTAFIHMHLESESVNIYNKMANVDLLQLKNMINKEHTTQQQEPVARSSGGPQTKTGQGTDS